MSSALNKVIGIFLIIVGVLPFLGIHMGVFIQIINALIIIIGIIVLIVGIK